MYPTIYHLVLDLFGLHLEPLKLLNTFGFLVALAFTAAAITLGRELERKEALGQFHATTRSVPPPAPPSLLDVAFSGFLTGFVALKVGGLAFGTVQLKGGTDAQHYLFSWGGHVPSAVVVGLAWTAYRFRQLRQQERALAKSGPQAPTEVTQHARDHLGGITGAAGLGGFLGAKIFHWLEEPDRIAEVFQRPSVEALFAGLTIYGGILGGGFFVWRYARRNKLAFPPLCDAVAPGLMAAYSVGRLGCQLSGDGDWGINNPSEPPTSWPLPRWFWSFDYPNNVLGAGKPLAEGGFPGYGTHLVPPVYPTPLYESLLALVFFLILWGLRKRWREPLLLSGLYLFLNGLARFWIEKIRVNARYSLFGWNPTQAELIAIVLMLVGGYLVVTRGRRQLRGTAKAPSEGATAASSG